MRKGELYLSSKDYEVSRSFVEIQFHRKDEMGTELWRPYREGKLRKVLLQIKSNDIMSKCYLCIGIFKVLTV